MTFPADLYEYYSGYVGRKTFVTVVGHSRSVPKYKTYVGTDSKRHILPEFGGNLDHLPAQSAYIVPDKAGYQSPMDGQVVEGRAAHREHMKVHNVIEVGDQPIGGGQRSNAPMPGIRTDIARSIQELSSR